MERKATVLWQGSLKQGHGEISTQSGALKSVAYSFNTRFEETPGTNPEELIAAAHASCFSMACAAAFSAKGFEPERLDVTATVTLQKKEDTWSVSSSFLKLEARVPHLTQDQFQTLTENAKKNCPISQLLKAEIQLEAHLEETDSRPWAPPPPQ